MCYIFLLLVASRWPSPGSSLIFASSYVLRYLIVGWLWPFGRVPEACAVLWYKVFYRHGVLYNAYFDLLLRLCSYEEFHYHPFYWKVRVFRQAGTTDAGSWSVTENRYRLKGNDRAQHIPNGWFLFLRILNKGLLSYILCLRYKIPSLHGHRKFTVSASSLKDL